MSGQLSHKTFKRVFGVIAASCGLLAGVLSQYYISVLAYRPSDPSATIGLYMLCFSILFWVLFLIVHFIGARK